MFVVDVGDFDYEVCWFVCLVDVFVVVDYGECGGEDCVFCVVGVVGDGEIVVYVGGYCFFVLLYGIDVCWGYGVCGDEDVCCFL